MKKSCRFLIIFYVVLVNFFHLQARDEYEPQFYFSAWPIHQSNPVTHVQAYTQINRVEKDSLQTKVQKKLLSFFVNVMRYL